MALILVIVNLLWGIITGVFTISYSPYMYCSAGLWFVASLFMAAGLSNKFINEHLAKERTPSNPVTSVERYYTSIAIWFLLVIVAVFGYLIVYLGME